MDKMKIIPIFVPHIGCPNDCVFCNQRKITGKGDVSPNKQYAEKIVEEYKKTIDDNTFTELAFFGGSFTAINIKLQRELLEVAKYYKDAGVIHRIRMSTRPDAINEEILNMQKEYGVDIIELGIQSLDDEVLKNSNRGHNRKDSEHASKLIKEFNFTLGHQIMPGLPGSTEEKDIKTCIDSIAMKPDMVRIYPTLIIKDTDLETMYKNNTYKPLTVEEAVCISANIYSRYMVNNINVIRIGLQNTETINEDADVVGGPFHPAFGQLVREEIFYTSLVKVLKDSSAKNIVINANNKFISFIAGQNKKNILKLKELYRIKKVSFKNNENADIISIYEGNELIGLFKTKDIFKNYLESH